MRRLKKAKYVLALAVCACGSFKASATTFTWINAAGGVFNNATNWNPLGAPSSSADVAVFSLNNTYTVTFSNSPVNGSLQVNDGAITFNLDGQTYGQAGATVGNVPGAAPRLTLSNGTVSATGLLGIATGFGSAGTMTVGSNAQYNVIGGGDTQVGASGAGAMIVQGGNFTTSGHLGLGGSAFGIGTVAVSGLGSTLNCGSIDMGVAGTGILNITGGGVANCLGLANNFMGGNNASATAVANVSGTGSTWNMSGALIAGFFGSATVNVSGGGHVINGFAVTLGSQSSGVGNIIVSGTGSSWDAPAGMNAGVFGRGQVDITSGGVINSGPVTLASNSSTSFGVANVSGAGSAWNCAGNMTLGTFGNASLTVSSGAAVNVSSNLLVNDPVGTPIGVFTLDGGTVACNSFTRLGTFNFNDGTLIVNGNSSFQNGPAAGPLVLNGNDAAANPTLALSGGGSVSNLTSLMVGDSRRASLMINDRGNLTATTIGIAAQPGSSGTIIVGGSGGLAQLTASGLVTVGGTSGIAGGAGNLIINSNGQVNVNGGMILSDGGAIQLNGGALAWGPNISVFVGQNLHQFDFNSGTLICNFTTSLTGFFVNLFLGPEHVLGPGQTLTNSGSFTLGFDGPLTIAGGLLGSNLSPSGSFSNSSNMLITSGGINTQGNLINNAGGLITLAGTGTIGLGSSTSTFVNNGTVQLASSQGVIKSNFGSFVNNGTLRGTGNVNLAFTNTASGQVLIGAGERIDFGSGAVGSGGSFSNSGQVSVIHGEAQFDVPANNTSTGAITGHDSTLRFNAGLTNAGSLLFTSGQSDVYGTITNNSASKIIVSGAGTATFYNPITNNTGAELRVSTGATGVFFGAVNGPGSITGSGLKIFEGGTSSLGPLATQTGSSLIESSASITADTVRESALTVSGQFAVRPNGTEAATSRLNSLVIDAGTMDLNDNDLVIDYTGPTPFNTIRGYVATVALRSSLAATSTTPRTALGIAENSVLGRTTFSGQPVDATSLLIKYTYAGDANLDGQVDVTDLGALATNWQTSAPWTGGDFNYDGFVDVTDLGALATNWQAGREPGTPGAPLAPTRLDQALVAVGLSPIAIPEPGFGLGAIGIMLALSRSRRR
jgi:T5SS/PEP-CTERM-associated repeat protein